MVLSVIAFGLTAALLLTPEITRIEPGARAPDARVLDVGTGDSDLTWQAMLGAGYAFDWGDLVAVWRYLDYDMPSGDLVENLDANGPAIGVTFKF